MNEKMDRIEKGLSELNDAQLDEVVGGYRVGDTVRLKRTEVTHCPGCGKVLTKYSATITHVRDLMDGSFLYYIKHSCCGFRGHVEEEDIIG